MIRLIHCQTNYNNSVDITHFPTGESFYVPNTHKAEKNVPHRDKRVVVVSAMQLVRLHSTICRHHPPQRAVLSQICCFGERKVVLFQILLDGAEPRDTRTTWVSSPVRRRGD